MPGVLGTLIAVVIVAGLAVLAARSLWRGRRNACSRGKCAACGSKECAHPDRDADAG